jgi:methionyl-tRNA synthetase
MKKYYITTPIYYVNDRPHIGHASTTIWADVQARFQRMAGREVFFLAGLDEHGTKVLQAARKKGIEMQAYCDEMAAVFTSLWKKLNISNDDFVRTTEPRHKKVVQQVLQQIYDKGEIYLAEHEGWYSPRAEQFVTEKEMVDGKFPEHYGEVTKISEKNYFFKMSKYQEWLIDYLKKHREFLQPESRLNEILGFLNQPLGDLCISRPKSRLPWGIEMPFDKDYVTYVWFDALINYISIPGYGEKRFADYWPADVHLMGKEIITTHAVYWPTMLKAIGIEMPLAMYAHGWWLFGGGKMSKSLGNVKNTDELIEAYGADAVRYFVCRELQLAGDSNYSDELFKQRYDSDLANDLGNLVNRSISMLQRYRDGKLPAPGAKAKGDEELEATAAATLEAYSEFMPVFQYSKALEQIARLVQRANQYVEENAPWKLAKDAGSAGRLDTVLNRLVEVVYTLGTILTPFLPETSQKIAAQLQVTKFVFSKKELACLNSLRAQHPVGAPTPLFPRLETAQS